MTHLRVIKGDRDDSWWADAACAGTDPNLFHSDMHDTQKQALRICAGCPVREPCLEYALVRHERFGVWGGASGRERRRLLKARAVTP